jgi:hypothetical protein
MDRHVRPPTVPSLVTRSATLSILAQRVATDELRLLQLESQDRVSDVMHRGMWIGFGALCLAIAWVAAWAAAVVALEDRFSLESRLAMLAITQFAFGRHWSGSDVADGWRRSERSVLHASCWKRVSRTSEKRSPRLSAI